MKKSEDAESTENTTLDASWLLSGVYCMLTVILSIVLCSSHYSTSDIDDVTLDSYYIFLTLLGSIWLIFFKPISTGFCHSTETYQEFKSNHSTNRWLKGILVVFGIAIIIKGMLDLLETTQYTDVECQNVVYYLAPISDMIFVVTEVNFLFQYSKVHLQEFQLLNRFGAMHVLATNLSVWMLIIIEESMTDEDTSNPSDRPNSPDFIPENEQWNLNFTATELGVISDMVSASECNTTTGIFQNLTEVIRAMLSDRQRASNYAGELFSPDGCFCNTTYCEMVDSTNSFLYPFLVEFSLIASCMIYIVWKNIGMIPYHSEPAVKPSYKFYKSYKGFMFGSVVLIVTIVILIFANHGVDENDDSYDYFTRVVSICNSYMTAVEFVMLIACAIGLALFRVDPRPLSMHLNLDVVLLMVTFAGAVTVDTYYAFAVYTSFISSNYDYMWIWGAVYPLMDIIQCVLQVTFLLGGLAREPIIESKNDPKTMASITGRDASDNKVMEVENKAFEISDEEGRSRPVGEKSITESTQVVLITDFTTSEVVTRSVDPCFFNMRAPQAIDKGVKTTKCVEFGNQQHRVLAMSSSHAAQKTALEERIRRHAERPRIAPPTLIHLYIREILMFLLISNACLWLFWSLQGQPLRQMSYPNQYYDSQNNNLWRSATMLCMPLAIFFRMHSCACIFEVWSFT